MSGWLNRKDGDIGRLIARKKYGEASLVLRNQLRMMPGSVQIRIRLADVLLLESKKMMALRILGRLADELAADGFKKKAAAVVRRHGAEQDCA